MEMEEARKILEKLVFPKIEVNKVNFFVDYKSKLQGHV